MGALHIISHSDEPFKDRQQAGRLLAEELKLWRGKAGVVLGIPRGGIIVAQELACFLSAELDIVLSRKLGAPLNSELAIGAVAEDGQALINKALAFETGADSAYIQEESSRQLEEISRRRKLYRDVRPKADLKGKWVVVTDDGLATGATMQSALWAARKDGPAGLIAALPVAAQESLEKISDYADEIICLRLPSFFAAVGQFYLEFGQTSDEEAIKILQKNYAQHPAREAGR